MLKPKLFLVSLLCVSLATSIFYTPCNESSIRTCSYGTNVTNRLLNLKKGGQNCVQKNTYSSNFFYC